MIKNFSKITVAVILSVVIAVTSCVSSGVNGHNMNGLAKGVTRNSYYVSISDATQIQRYIAKISKFNELQTYTADVDCSDTIDIFDATLIQKYLAKMYGY